MIPCKVCKKKPDEVNHPPGMMFVGFGLGWQTCSNCGGTGRVRAASPWGWSNLETPETWTGTADSREEAIGEGREMYRDEPFWITQGEWLDLDTLIDADDVLEMMSDRLRDDGPSEAELYIQDGGEAALNEMLKEWTKKYVVSSGYWTQIGKPERIEANGVE